MAYEPDSTWWEGFSHDYNDPKENGGFTAMHFQILRILSMIANRYVSMMVDKHDGQGWLMGMGTTRF